CTWASMSPSSTWRRSMASAMAERHWLAVQTKRMSMAVTDRLYGVAARPLRLRSGVVAPDPRTPVIVGAGQLLRKPNQALDLAEPVDMLVEALLAAAADASAPA